MNGLPERVLREAPQDRWWPKSGPFCLDDAGSYACWREAKLAAYPTSAPDLFAAIGDLAHPTREECTAIRKLCSRANMAIYQCAARSADAAPVRLGLRSLARALGLRYMEDHRSGEADGIVAIEVSELAAKAGYIPYSNRPLSWHTDGYYNFHGPSDCVQAMLLHCVRDAPAGGVTSLLDHEIAYIRLRDMNPAYIAALMHPEAMTIPAGEEAGGRPRPDNTGPVFFVEPKSGALSMRYTARKRYVYWRCGEITRCASEALEDVLASDPLIVKYKLRPGEGIVCNNVLHCRSGFLEPGPHGSGRLLYRVRYHDRVSV
jgi:hypothetical protein